MKGKIKMLNVFNKNNNATIKIENIGAGWYNHDIYMYTIYAYNTCACYIIDFTNDVTYINVFNNNVHTNATINTTNPDTIYTTIDAYIDNIAFSMFMYDLYANA